jgi:hypothetical protein
MTAFPPEWTQRADAGKRCAKSTLGSFRTKRKSWRLASGRVRRNGATGALARISNQTKRRKRRMWRYKGFDIFPADRNSSGIRWYTRVDYGPLAVLRADTKAGMREIIRDYLAKNP